MLCERCGKREATVNVVCVINDTRVSKWLCESCAKEFAAEGVMAGQKGENARNILEEFFKPLRRLAEKNYHAEQNQKDHFYTDLAEKILSFLYRSGRKDSDCRAPDGCPAPAGGNRYRTYFVGDAAGTGEPGSTSAAAVRRG